MISTLIALVLSLILQAQNPKVPIPQKIAALELAEQILTIAAQEQQASSTTPAQVTVQITAPSAVTAPATTATPQAQEITAAPTQPTCTLTAEVLPVTKLNEWQTLLKWTFTQGATAVITSGGLPVQTQWPSNILPSGAPDGEPSDSFVTPLITQATDYEMDVSLNGLTGSCTASTTIPTGN